MIALSHRTVRKLMCGVQLRQHGEHVCSNPFISYERPLRLVAKSGTIWSDYAHGSVDQNCVRLDQEYLQRPIRPIFD